jgi:hypothetical protein
MHGEDCVSHAMSRPEQRRRNGSAATLTMKALAAAAIAFAAGAPGGALADTPAAGAAPAAARAKPLHPAIRLLDENGVSVLSSHGPVSTRKSCGDCHDYDFITDSFHFQQGRTEMDRALLQKSAIAPFNVSPGMFGKFSIIPNRQLTALGITTPDDFDMGTPEWLTKCGVCHTGSGISEFDSEGRRFGTVDPSKIAPLDRDYHYRDRATGTIAAWDWKKSGVAEGDCFLCHVPAANRGERRERMAAGDFRWADTATLAGTGVVQAGEDGTFAYLAAAFNADGTVKPEVLDLSDPTLENCAQCHGFTARNTTTIQPIQHRDIMRGTEKAGWIYNGARIGDTVSPKIVGKETMDYPWDVHAAKGMVCIDCHFSPNNPGRMIQDDPAKNLRYRLHDADLATYLRKPDHNFARGSIPPETVNVTKHFTMRGCADCHEAEKLHAFLPYKSLHFEALACQTCHIPAVHFWAYRSDEWGFLLNTGTARITFRGIDGSIVDPDAQVTGFKPAYITSKDRLGKSTIRPTNLITGVYWWDTDKARPAFTWQVQKAFFESRESDGTWVYRPEVAKLFGDADEFIDVPQAVYDSPEKVALVAALLKRYGGIAEPELRIEVVPWAMSHSIAGKDQAIRECTACHAADSMLERPMALDDVLPAAAPAYFGGARRDVVARTRSGPVFDNRVLLSSFYVIGNTRVGWIEVMGWLAVAGASLFATLHGALRLVLGGRK